MKIKFEYKEISGVYASDKWVEIEDLYWFEEAGIHSLFDNQRYNFRLTFFGGYSMVSNTIYQQTVFADGKCEITKSDW